MLHQKKLFRKGPLAFTMPSRLDKRPGAGPGGFTLIELVCALTLLVVGAYGVFMLLLIAIQSDAESAHYSLARARAQQLMEGWRTTPVTALQPVSSTPASELPGGAYTVTIVPQNSSAQNTLDLVTVKVTWKEPGRGTDTFTLDTYQCSGGVSSQ